ncbi:MAG: hypothetical protein JXR61_02120 [Prolixibacteraceae bacterium]|nr:hypothetical protein [Prolixibacteraceae bacterium]
MTLHRFLSDSGTVIILIISAFGIYKFRTFSKELKIILFFVILGAVTELFTDYYKTYIARNTMPIGHFYYVSSILLLSFFYRSVLAGYIKYWIINTFIILFTIYAIINILFIQSIYDFPNLIGSVGALMLIMFSILFFARIMTEAKIKSLRKEPLVWVNIGALFYYAGSFFYFILFNLNVKNAIDFAKQVGTFMTILTLAFYVFIAIGFLKSGKNKFSIKEIA